MIHHRKAFSVLIDAWKSSSSDHGEIISEQNRQLRRIIHHAYMKVPYYRKLFDKAKISPSDIHTAKDLEALPLTSKKYLKKLPIEERMADGTDPKKLIVIQTSGSSGIPFKTLNSKQEIFLFRVFGMRAMKYYGMKSSDKVVRIKILEDPNPVPLPWKILQGFGIYRQTLANAFDSPENILDTLIEENADIITGNSMVFMHVSKLMEKKKEKSIHPRFLVVGENTLTPFIKRKIEEAFRVPIYDVYATTEIRLIAWQCKETGMYHVNDDGLILEVLRDESPVREGEQGEAVVTALYSYAMPLIRYRLDDIITKGPETCPCGKPFSTIKAIQGRMQDWFCLPEGRRLYPEALDIVFNLNAPWMLQYELIQEREDRVLLRAVASSEPSTQELASVQQKSLEILGPGVEFKIDLVDEISANPEDKFRHIRTEVKRP